MKTVHNAHYMGYIDWIKQLKNSTTISLKSISLIRINRFRKQRIYLFVPNYNHKIRFSFNYFGEKFRRRWKAWMKTKYSISLTIVLNWTTLFGCFFFSCSFSRFLWKIIMKIIIDMSLSNDLNANSIHTIPICIQNILCEYFQSGKCIFSYESQHTHTHILMHAMLTHTIFALDSIQCYTKKKFRIRFTTEE